MAIVIKRNGKKVPFNIIVIERNIKLAALESDTILKLSEIKLISAAIIDKIKKSEVHVEEIQEFVQISLMEQGFFKIATDYIEYRNKHKIRIKKEYQFLSDSFLSKYKHLPDPFKNQLGAFVYYRTYSRYIIEEKRRERWWETVARAVDYNCSLGDSSKKEAEELFDTVYNLRGFLSGRSLWVGGTKVADISPQSNFNCAFDTIDSYENFYELFYLLMIGSGVGLKITAKEKEVLPLIRTNVEIINKHYNPVPRNKRTEHTILEFSPDNSIVKIIIGDSKMGWATSLRYFFELLTANHFIDISTIIFNYDNVRPKGEMLKTFGGYASGHAALVNMYEKIDKVLKNGIKAYRRLETVDLMDIANIIGENVVSGGVRRTSELILFDYDDDDILTAKNNIYTLVDGEWKVNEELIHRQMSNNSILYKEKPDRAQLHWHISQMRYTGEPAWVSMQAAKKRRKNFQGVNPCGEVLLDNKGMCNLVTLVISEFVENGILNESKVKHALKLLTRASYRLTNIEMELPRWNAVHKRDALIGVSMTGYQDMINLTNLSMEKQAELLRSMRKVVNKTAKDIALMMGTNEPVLTTTLKPEGSLSQLPTVSSGVHYSHSPYYIRRVRINANDPMVEVVKELNWRMVPEVGQSEPNIKTYVVEFPVKAPKGRTKYDVGAIEQLENYKMFMENYVEHNCFSSDTEFITPNGIKTFNDFNNGDKVMVLAGNRKWSEATVKEYNEQELFTLKLKKSSSKRGTIKEIDVTKNHRWLVRSRGRNIMKLTSELKKGDSICVNYLNNQNIVPSIEGIQNGIVYGDGTLYNKTKKHLKSQIYLVGHKRELTKYFIGIGSITERNDIDQTRIYGLNGDLKFLPNIDNNSLEYLLGFLMGWIGTDGTVDKNGNTQVNTSDPFAVEWIKKVSFKLGLSLGDIYIKEHGGYANSKRNYNIPISKATLHKNWFITTRQQDRFFEAKHYKYFTVQSIDFKEIKKTWCVEEPKTNQFTLKDNILTYNCSITVHVREHEWEEVEQWVWDNWSDVVAVSFLSLDDNAYELLPYEEIDEKEYLKRKAEMLDFKPSLISKYESGEDFELNESECSSGACPIK